MINDFRIGDKVRVMRIINLPRYEGDGFGTLIKASASGESFIVQLKDDPRAIPVHCSDMDHAHIVETRYGGALQ